MFRKLVTAILVGFVLLVGLVIGGLTEEVVDEMSLETRETLASSYCYDEHPSDGDDCD